MKKVIFKYQLHTTDFQNVVMPKGAEILTVQIQHGSPCIWAIVNPDEQPEERKIRIYGTGHQLDESTGKYIGTYQLANGNFIGHVFDQSENK